MGRGVTKEQIARAKSVGIEEYILKNESNNIKRVGKAYYLKDHNSVEISNNLWNWHSKGIGGKSALDFIIKVRGYDFVDAVRLLAGEDCSRTRAKTDVESPPTRTSEKLSCERKSASEQKLFTLPSRNINNTRVIAYLQSRGISKPVIMDCIKCNILYESMKYHNAVFLGRDENGKARFAAMRGTFGNFKQDAIGSDKRFGFIIPPVNAQSQTVAAFESPIDALSHKTLFPNVDVWRISLGGVALAALENFLDNHSNIENIIVCTDNDQAGELAAEKIAELPKTRELPRIKVTRSPPGIGAKDFNETLLKIQKMERMQCKGSECHEL